MYREIFYVMKLKQEVMMLKQEVECQFIGEQISNVMHKSKP